MKAVVYREYAPDDDYAKILKVEDIDSPKPKPDEVVLHNRHQEHIHGIQLLS